MKHVYNYVFILHKKKYLIKLKKFTTNFFHQVKLFLFEFIDFFLLGAYYSINIDQRVMNFTKNNMNNLPNRYTFDEAQVN
jgi:hypothetical protein